MTQNRAQKRQQAKDLKKHGMERTCRGGRGTKGPACTACCTTMAIATLGKAAGEPCPYLSADPRVEGGQVCSVHGKSAMPRECRAFECGWLRDGKKASGNIFYSEPDRPDISGIMFTTQVLPANPGEPTMVIREVVADALHTARSRRIITTFAANLLCVLVPMEGNRRVVGPPELMDKFAAWVRELKL